MLGPVDCQGSQDPMYDGLECAERTHALHFNTFPFYEASMQGRECFTIHGSPEVLRDIFEANVPRFR